MKKILYLLLLLVFSAKLNAQTWTTYNTTLGKDSSINGISGGPSDSVYNITIDTHGNIWLATWDGVAKFNGTNWNSFGIDFINNNPIFAWMSSCSIDASGNQWFGSSGGEGVFEFAGTTWANSTNYTTANGLVNNGVNAIAIDVNGNKWFGTWGGVSEFDGTTWTNYTTANGLLCDTVFSIAIDAQGNKWFGTASGVSKFNGTTWTNYTTANGLANNWVQSIAIDAIGNIWFGTSGGVSELNINNTWTNYTTASGLVCDSVIAIAIDSQGNKWFGTGQLKTNYQNNYSAGNIKGGVSKFAGANYQLGGGGPAWTTYTTANSGLVNNNVNSITIDAQGNKWFATDDGVSELSDGACSFNLTSAIGTNTQTVCANSAITPITYYVTDTGNITPAGLLQGLTSTHNAHVFTISGTPTTTVTGSYSYSIGAACSTGSNPIAKGTITVNPPPIAIAGGSDTICQNSTATVTRASAANGTILWTDNGADSITLGANTLTPTYTPATGDAGKTVILTMTVTSTNTCAPQTATASYSVTVNSTPAPKGTISGNITNYTSGTHPNVTFKGSSGLPPYTFSYTINGGNINTVTTLGNNDSLSIAVLDTTTANYTYELLQVASANGCSQSESDSIVFTINPVLSVNELSAKGNSVTLFPNPCSNHFQVVVNVKSSVKITDVIGNTIYMDTVESGTSTIETSTLVSGIYFITFTNENGSVTKKLIKN